jgi:AIR synthase-related protein
MVLAMNTPLEELASALRQIPGVAEKIAIQSTYEPLGSHVCSPAEVPGIAAGQSIRLGDDCAAIPASDSEGGYLLFATEGLIDTFVNNDPWFAGYSAVMVNISDVCSMGGRPIAVVDALWSTDAQTARPIWDGMLAASNAYGVPIVGGHTSYRARSSQLSVSILGRAKELLTSFDAAPGNVLVMAIDLRGAFYRHYPFWNASTSAPGERLRGDIALLPAAAENALAHAAKDISMGGIIGTLIMLLESSNVGAVLDLDAIPRPPGEIDTALWLSCFPSFGYLFATSPEKADDLTALFEGRGIASAVVGEFNDSRSLTLTSSNEKTVFWNSPLCP